jgi:hypothetical protein
VVRVVQRADASAAAEAARFDVAGAAALAISIAAIDVILE